MRLAKILIPITLGLVLVTAACGAPAPTATPAPTPTPPPAATRAPAATPAPTPTPPPAPTAAPTPTPVSAVPDNFRLLISDAPNAIGDFSSLVVEIDHIGVRPSAKDAQWLQFEPDEDEVDLTLLVGDNAQEVWSGPIPEGTYTKVFIYVDEVSGVLKGGKEVEVKLPSSKLQISKPFEVAAGAPVNFVFDVSVVAAGSPKAKGGIKYILLPQLGKSGAGQQFREVTAGRPEKPAGGLRLSLEGDPQPGASVVLVVTHQQGGPAEGAAVTVDGQDAGTTDSEGRLELNLPQADEVEIEATLGRAEGELEIRLEGEEAEAQEFTGIITAITDGADNSSPWTMEIEGVAGVVTVVVVELEEGTPEVGRTARVEGVLHEGVIADAEAEVEATPAPTPTPTPTAQASLSLIEEAFASVLDKVVVIFIHDEGGLQGFQGPSTLTLTTVETGKGYWLYAPSATTLSIPDFQYSLFPGWNPIGWVGGDTPVGSVMAAQSSDIYFVLGFDASQQRWAVYQTPLATSLAGLQAGTTYNSFMDTTEGSVSLPMVGNTLTLSQFGSWEWDP